MTLHAPRELALQGEAIALAPSQSIRLSPKGQEDRSFLMNPARQKKAGFRFEHLEHDPKSTYPSAYCVQLRRVDDGKCSWSWGGTAEAALAQARAKVELALATGRPVGRG